MSSAANAALAKGSLVEVKSLLDAALDDPSPASRQVVCRVIECAADEGCNATFSQEMCEYLLSRLRRMGSFGEETLRCHEILADHYENAGKYKELVQTLSAITFDGCPRSSSDLYQLAVHTRIAFSALGVEDIVTADSLVMKAWPLFKRIQRTTDTASTVQQFLACYASVLDIKRKCLDAALRYVELSRLLDEKWPLERAIVCVILADAGPQRSRLLSALYKDERTAALGDLFSILSKVFHARVLRPRDATMLEPYLKPHHKAITGTGRTFVANAISQHNIQAASQLYRNISFSELGSLLGIDAAEAEKVVAQMIAEDRLKATLDQLTETIHFHSTAAAPINDWDSQILSVCNAVSAVGDAILNQHPQYLPLIRGLGA